MSIIIHEKKSKKSFEDTVYFGALRAALLIARVFIVGLGIAIAVRLWLWS